MAPDKHRVVGSAHYHDGEFYADGEIIEDVPESILRRFPTKFEEVGAAAESSTEDTDDEDEEEGSDEPDDPDEAEDEPESEPVDDEPEPSSDIPDDHTTLRQIASQNDLGEGIDGRSSSADIVAALEALSDDERETILSDTDLDSGE